MYIEVNFIIGSCFSQRIQTLSCLKISNMIVDADCNSVQSAIADRIKTTRPGSSSHTIVLKK